MHGGHFESPSSRRVCTVSNRRSAHDGVHNRAVGWPLSVASARDDHHRLHQLLFSSLIYSSPPPYPGFIFSLYCSAHSLCCWLFIINKTVIAVDYTTSHYTVYSPLHARVVRVYRHHVLLNLSR